MTAFLLRRVAFVSLLVLAVTSVSFVLVHTAPGDFFTDFAPGAERRAAAGRAAAGMDRPLPVRYAAWLGRAARFDLGTSLKFQRPVRELVVPRMRSTALLGILALVLAIAAGVPLGVLTATGDGGMLRTLVRAASSAVLAVPPLVVALVLTAAAARFGWLPPPGLELANILVPALALALPAAAVIERTHSQAVRAALGRPYIRATIARGVSWPAVVWKHAQRDAFGATLGWYGVLAGTLLSGSFAVELIADWPGLALLTAEAVRARDPSLVCGCAAAAAVLLAGAVLLSDLLHFWADPTVSER